MVPYRMLLAVYVRRGPTLIMSAVVNYGDVGVAVGRDDVAEVADFSVNDF